MSAAAVKAYFTDSNHDYYIDGHNAPGMWGGKLADQLGLHGEVQKEHFHLLSDGFHPITGEDLVIVRQPDRRSANDITMSAPKDFSLIYLAASPQARKELIKAFDASCDWIMGEMESDAGARVRMGNADFDRTTGNWAYAGFTQFESRPDNRTQLPVIQIHRHHTVFNLTNDPVEQRIKALQIGIVKENANYFMPLWHNDLARRVRELGFGIKKDAATGIVGFSIAGVPREMVERFSPRRATIKAFREGAMKWLNSPEFRERLAEELGTQDGYRIDQTIKSRVKQLQNEIGKITRKHKQKDLTLADLWKVWEGQLTPKDRWILNAAKGQKGFVTTDAEAARYAKEHLFYRHSVIEKNAKKKLLIEALRYGVGSVTAEGVEKELVRQGVIFKGDDATTKETWQQEGEMIDFARQGRGSVAPVSSKSVEELIRPGGIKLSGQQLAALEALIHSTSRVNIVDAGQGTGKTTLHGVYAQVLADAHVNTLWLGTTHTAVKKLQEQGLPAMTLAHFLASEKEQAQVTRGTRIILDEHSMLNHGDAYKLFMFAKERGCRVDLTGDTKQYKAPVAGAPVDLLIHFAGIEPITMTETMRQTGRLKEAMNAIRDDRELEGHKILTELGMVHELPQEELAQKAAELYLEWSKGGEFVPCVSPTHVQADEIAAKIREGLHARGDLKGEDQEVRRLFNLGWSPAQVRAAKEQGVEGIVFIRGNAYRDGMQKLAVGDLVRTTRNGESACGHQIKNGTSYRIKAIKGDEITLNNDWRIKKEWGGLVQNYVRTGQGLQGDDGKRGIVVYGTPALVATRHDGYYTPVSRVRQEVAVLTDSIEALTKAIQRREPRKSATELMQQKVIPIEVFLKTKRHREYYARLREQRQNDMERKQERYYGYAR